MKKIWVRVHPQSKQVKVVKRKILPGLNHSGLEVYLTQAAINNQANIQLIEVIATYIKIKKNQVFILKGATNKNKLIGISQ